MEKSTLTNSLENLADEAISNNAVGLNNYLLMEFFYGGEPALLVGLDLVRGPNITSPLHGFSSRALTRMLSLIFPSPPRQNIG